jgi:hypothetical protein
MEAPALTLAWYFRGTACRVSNCLDFESTRNCDRFSYCCAVWNPELEMRFFLDRDIYSVDQNDTCCDCRLLKGGSFHP